LNHLRELLLHNFDALLDDGVGLERANGLDVKVELVGYSAVVEGSAICCGLFPVGVF
jgi:hypothetical protein